MGDDNTKNAPDRTQDSKQESRSVDPEEKRKEVSAEISRDLFERLAGEAEKRGQSLTETATEILEDNLEAAPDPPPGLRKEPVPEPVQAEMMDEGGLISGVYEISLKALQQDQKQLNDTLSEMLVGHGCLSGIRYEPVKAASDHSIYLRIKGYLEGERLENLMGA